MTRTARVATPFVAAAFAALSACASGGPATALHATTATGRIVPLDSLTVSYTVDGVHVIQRPNFATDVVAVNLYLLGGARQLTRQTQGIEALLMASSRYGSAAYPGRRTREAWLATGSRYVIEPRIDWTLVGFRGVRQEFDSSWSIFADRVMHPSLTRRAVDTARARLIARWRDLDASPLITLVETVDSVAFAGHPYALRTQGTVATLSALDSAALARYAAAQLVTSRMLLVVVGAVTRAEVERAVARTLGALPRGHYVWHLPPEVPRTASSVTMVSDSGSVDYIFAAFGGPLASDSLAPAFRLTGALLSARIDRALIVAGGRNGSVSTPQVADGVSAGAVLVATTVPERVLPVMKSQLATMRDFHEPGWLMHVYTDGYVYRYLAGNITNAAQADLLARAELYEGDFHRAARALEELRRVSPSQVRDAARLYLRDIHVVYLGDTTRVSRAAFTGF